MTSRYFPSASADSQVLIARRRKLGSRAADDRCTAMRILLRCPDCGRQDHYTRRGDDSLYQCRCGSEF
jgi:hypothetical protein